MVGGSQNGSLSDGNQPQEYRDSETWAVLVWVYLLLIPLVTVPLTYYMADAAGFAGAIPDGMPPPLSPYWALPGLLNLLPGLLLVHPSPLVRSNAFWGFLMGVVRLLVLPIFVVSLDQGGCDGVIISWPASMALWAISFVGLARRRGKLAFVSHHPVMIGVAFAITTGTMVAALVPGGGVDHFQLRQRVEAEGRVGGWLEAVHQGDAERALDYWTPGLYTEGRCWFTWLYEARERGGWDIETVSSDSPFCGRVHVMVALRYSGNEPLELAGSPYLGGQAVWEARRLLLEVAVDKSDDKLQHAGVEYREGETFDGNLIGWFRCREVSLR